MEKTKIAEAIYVVNCHAKTATHPKELYYLKKAALLKLLHEDHAEIMSLYRYSSQPVHRERCYILVRCANYYFHILPTTEDFDMLSIIDGSPEYRNPKARISLKAAKVIIRSYLHSEENNITSYS